MGEERRLFGEIAISKGFLTLPQLQGALKLQRELHESNRAHKLIGVLLVELGYMTGAQVAAVLESYDEEERQAARAAEAAAKPTPEA